MKKLRAFRDGQYMYRKIEFREERNRRDNIYPFNILVDLPRF